MQPASDDFSLVRILFGPLPWHSVIELLLRAAVIFCFTVLAVRSMGKHGVAQLPPIDRVLLITLGVAAGYGIFATQVPLVHALLALTMLVLMQLGMARLTRHSRDLHVFLRAQTRRIVFNGRIDTDTLRAVGLSRDALFTALREAGIEQLGQVRAAFLEPSGRISVLRFAEGEAPVGLPLAPLDDGNSHRSRLHRALEEGSYACTGCGHVVEFSAEAAFTACSCCNARRWLPVHPGPASREAVFHGEPVELAESVHQTTLVGADL